MATIASGLLTADEFYDWCQRPENRDRHFELERGEITEMPPPGKFHGFVCLNIGVILHAYAARRGRGYVCSNDAGVIVQNDPDTVRGPDLTFYDDDQTADTMERKYADEPPLLAVEVLSPEDRVHKVLRRVTQLLARGVPLVWVIDSETRDVSVYRHGREAIVYEGNQELTGEDVLPEFRCRVSEFFARPGA
jgi:Uma2 family endonuclease